MNSSYACPSSFFDSSANVESSDTINYKEEARKTLESAIKDPVFDTMTDGQVTGYLVAGIVTAFIALFAVTYFFAFTLASIAVALGLPIIVQFVIGIAPSILSFFFMDELLHYFISPVISKSMVFYAKAVTAVKHFFNKK